MVIAAVGIAMTAYVFRVPRSPFVDATEIRSAAPGSLYLQQLGNCIACHSVPEGRPFAGGLKMGTPLGILYSTNITPDDETGIGRYSLADFDIAVRHGIAKDGRRLYPAMPYPSYAKLTDEDVRGLYSYFKFAVQPARQVNHSTEIRFPLNQRWMLAFWNAIFAKAKPYEYKNNHDRYWNRGAYLLQALGHCGACHTPRGWAFNEEALDESADAFLGGALLDGWYASDLRSDPLVGLGGWSESDVVVFLKSGHNDHATVFGSMLDAFNNSTQFMDASDLKAVARYLKTLGPREPAAAPSYRYDSATEHAFATGDLRARGAGLYLNQCSSCHGLDGKGYGQLLPPLAGSITLSQRDPSSLLNLILNGSGRIVANGIPDAYRMPPFRVLLSDQEIAELASFVRSSWGNVGLTVTVAQVQALRGATDVTSDHVIVLSLR
jgi:mono/diheme cytochrome c family protein